MHINVSTVHCNHLQFLQTWYAHTEYGKLIGFFFHDRNQISQWFEVHLSIILLHHLKEHYNNICKDNQKALNCKRIKLYLKINVK